MQIQLDQYQRRAMLYRTEEVLFHGEFIARGPQVARGSVSGGMYRYLGDIVQQNEAWLCRCKNIDRQSAFHVQRAVWELAQLSLDTELDARTAQAFEEAKHTINMGWATPENAWPAWYNEGQPSPLTET